MFGRKSYHCAIAGITSPRTPHLQDGRRSSQDLPSWLAPLFMKRHFPFGPGRHGHRMFARGDLKYALLELLQERPKHGYEMMKELENRAGGFYTPSAGAIYPTLQMMEDRAWVISREQDGRKIYTITDDGRQALKEQEPAAPDHDFTGPPGPPPWAFGFDGNQPRPELDALGLEFREMARLVWTTIMQSRGNVQRIEQVRAILARTRTDIQALVHDDSDQNDVSI